METDFPPVIPPSLCALPISSQEVACPSHLDLSATGDDDKSCANFHIPRNVRRPVLDRAPSGLVNVAVGWHSPNLATFSESVGMTKARPIALWWCSFCPATAPANDHLSIGLLPEIDHAVCRTYCFWPLAFQNRENSPKFSFHFPLLRCNIARLFQLFEWHGH